MNRTLTIQHPARYFSGIAILFLFLTVLSSCSVMLNPANRSEQVTFKVEQTLPTSKK